MKQWKPGEPLSDSDHALLQPLIDWAAATGMTPTVKEIPTASQIKNRFRIWKDAIMAAGLQPLNAAEQQYLRNAMHNKNQSNQEKNGGSQLPSSVKIHPR